MPKHPRDKMKQSVREKASSRGSWPKGPERAKDEIPAAKGRLIVNLSWK